MYTPKLVTVLREGYSVADLRDDVLSGPTVAIVALPLRRGVRVFITGTSQAVRRALLTHGARPPRVKYRTDISNAVAEIKTHLAAARAASATPALP